MSEPARAQQATAVDAGARPQVFIACSGLDESMARRVKAKLEQLGLATWLYVDDGEILDPPTSDIIRSMRSSAALLVLVSKHAMTATDYVYKELRFAQSLGRPVILLMVDGTPLDERVGFHLPDSGRINALKPDWEEKLQRLAAGLLRSRERPPAPAPAPAPPPPRPRVATTVLGVAALAAAALAVVGMTLGGEEPLPSPRIPDEPPDIVGRTFDGWAIVDREGGQGQEPLGEFTFPQLPDPESGLTVVRLRHGREQLRPEYELVTTAGVTTLRIRSTPEDWPADLPVGSDGWTSGTATAREGGGFDWQVAGRRFRFDERR